MRKYFALVIIFLFCSPVLGQKDFTNTPPENQSETKMSVVCSSDQRRCTIGEHYMKSTVKPLFVSDGIVCSSDRKTCTNGFSYIRSSSPIEIVANSVICKKNKKTCLIGKHTVVSNTKEPLYIDDGIVCTSDKKTCTNGYSYMHSNNPLR